ncbi:MAG: DUF3034 family protein [Gallionellaceae bacterium]|nr:DUF3034 family protein [Gallionellaceae bacterium]
MKKKIVKYLSPLMALIATPAALAVPLPLHSIEGYGGILLTGSAFLANPAKDGGMFGLPTVSLTSATLGYGRHLEAYTLTETIGGRVELGFGQNRLDLGEFRADVKAATGADINERTVTMNNFNVRALLLKEEGNVPAVTLGLHYKRNETIKDMDNRLGGALTANGLKNDHGTDVTLYATRLFTTTPRPLLVNVGLRSTKAAQIGLIGFTDKRKTMFEGNFGYMILNNLVIGGEYRQKPHEYTPIARLIEKEGSWGSAFMTYIANDHMTASVAYMRLGDVLNHAADNAYGFKFKYEF